MSLIGWICSEVRFGGLRFREKGDDICMINSGNIFFSSQAFRVHNDVGNTVVQLKQNLDQRFWRYNTINREKGMLSNFHNHKFVVYKQLCLILTLQMQGLFKRTCKSMVFEIFVVLVNRKPMLFNSRDSIYFLFHLRIGCIC